MSLRIRRGTDLERSTILFDQGEIVYTTDTQRLYVGDGITLGGIAAGGISAPEAEAAAASLFTSGTHTGISFSYDPEAGTVDATVTGSAPISYGISAETTTGGVNLRLSGSDASVDNVKFAQGANITLTRTDANTITIAATGGGGGASALNDLTDVVITGTPADGEVLKYSTLAGTWINAAESGGGGGASALDDLTDVVITGPVGTGEVLTYDGTNWVNGAAPVTGLTALLDDTSPALGGNLDLNGFNISGDAQVALTTEAIGLDMFKSVTNSDANTARNVVMERSRGTTATPTSVVNGDNLGTIKFRGHDGTDYIESAYILTSVDGAVSTGIVPSKILFATEDLLGSLDTRVTIDSDGKLNALFGSNLISTGDSQFGSSDIRFFRSRGTTASRSVVDNNDVLSRVVTLAYDGTDYVVSGAISTRVEGTVTPGSGIVPTSMDFLTMDSTGVLTTAMAITSGGTIDPRFTLNFYNNGGAETGPCNINFLRSRGGYSSPTSVASGDLLHQLVGVGYDGDNYITSSAIRFYADPLASVGTNIVPGRITLLTADATGTVQTAAFIDSSQRLHSLGGITSLYDNDFTTSPLLLTSYGVSGGASPTTTANSFAMRRYRGTLASPQALQNGDAIFDILWSGADGVNPLGITCAVIRGKAAATGTITPGNVPGQIIIQTRNNAGTLGTRVNIDSYVTNFVNMPRLPTFADETAANAAVSAAGGAANGMMYYDSGAGKIKGYQSGAWVVLQP